MKTSDHKPSQRTKSTSIHRRAQSKHSRSTNSSRVKQCHASPYPNHPTLTEVPPAGLKIILMQRQSYPISDMISPMSHQGRLSDSRPLRRRSALDSHDMITALRGKRLPREKERKKEQTAQTPLGAHCGGRE